MDDLACGRYTVERRPAREICAGDDIVYRESAALIARRVTQSDPLWREHGKWRLKVEKFGSADVPIGQYISRVL
jgi:hypothetical protein